MLPLIEAELGNVAMSLAQRAQLCKQLAGPLEVRAGALEEGSFSVSDVPADERERFQEVIEPWPKSVNGAELLQEIFGLYERFVVVDDRGFITVSLWTVLPYIYKEFHKIPVLRIKSPQKRCGKSTLLDVLELLVSHPLITVSITPATLYRLIEKFHPTVLIDEAESFSKDDDDLRAIVNGGFERNRRAWRTNKETHEPESFDTFGCKVLASIKGLHETIEDRSLFIDMIRKPRDIELEELCDVDHEPFSVLRRKIQRWTDDNRKAIRDIRLPRPKILADRSWNKWRPLLTIAHLAGAHWYKMAVGAASGMVADHDSERNLAIEVLNQIRAFFREQEPKYGKSEAEFQPTGDILEFLNSDDEAPWADWKSGDKKRLTAEKLSRILKPFGLKSDQHQIEGKRYRGYWRKDFQPVFDSYLDPEQPGQAL
jgi:putative DNA primase/helicase